MTEGAGLKVRPVFSFFFQICFMATRIAEKSNIYRIALNIKNGSVCFLSELHEVRGLGNQILQRGRKGTGSPSLPPEIPGGRDRAKGTL